MEIIRNFSVIILFFGIIMLTIYVTKSFCLDTNRLIRKSHKSHIDKDSLMRRYVESKPSKVFKNMFRYPSVWLGYNDTTDINYANISKQEKLKI